MWHWAETADDRKISPKTQISNSKLNGKTVFGRLGNLIRNLELEIWDLEFV